MYRLTTDNPNGNTEIMRNMAYIKDGWIAIREMELPFTDYLKQQCTAHGCDGYMDNVEPEDLFEAMCECSFTTPHCPIFLLYAIAIQAVLLRDRLSKYEDSNLTPHEVMELVRFKHLAPCHRHRYSRT